VNGHATTGAAASKRVACRVRRPMTTLPSCAGPFAAPQLWLLLSELYPLAVRGKAMALGTVSCWLWTTVVVFVFPPLTEAIGVRGGMGRGGGTRSVHSKAAGRVLLF
jgi:hypothetical protein